MNIPTTLDNPTHTLIGILLVIIITLILTRLVAFLINKTNRFHENKAVVYLIRDIITYIIYFIALMVILQFFGINLAGTLLSLGIVGIAVSFAAKDIISNLFSGIILIIGKTIEVGNTIEIKDKKGIVEKMSLRSTTIVDDNGIRDIIPNSTLTNFPYLQYKTTEKSRVDIIGGLALDIDIEEFRDYLIKKMSEYDGILENPKPDVYAKGITFEESQIKVSFWVKDFNSKDKYKLIIINEIRKFTQMGEKNE